MRKHAADVAMAGLLAVLGLAMAIHSVSYRILVEGGRIGPGFLPFVAGLALTAFAAWAGAGTALRARRRPSDPSDPSQPGKLPQPPQRSRARTVRLERKVALVFLLTLGAIVLTSLTGFLIAFGVLVFVLLAAVEREPITLAAVIAVVAVGVSWLVFVRLLGVPLPGGALGLLGVA